MRWSWKAYYILWNHVYMLMCIYIYISKFIQEFCWLDRQIHVRYLIYLLFQFVLFLLLDIFRIFAKEGPNGVSLVRNLHLKECHAIKTQKSCVCVCTYVHASLTLVKRWINQTSDFFFYMQQLCTGMYYYGFENKINQSYMFPFILFPIEFIYCCLILHLYCISPS